MRIRTIPIVFGCLLVGAWLAPSASAGWIWSPRTGWIGPGGAVKDTPEEQLEHAVGLFEQAQYDDARKEFRKLLRAYKDSREAAEAQYYLGRCDEAQRDYYAAFKAYRKTIQTYPSTQRFDEILEREYQIANHFLSGKKRKLFGTAAVLPARDSAIEIFKAIVEDGPFSEHGPLAQYKLGLAHFALHDYEEAIGAFEQVIARYPESPLVDDARFQIAMASLKGTFEPTYDQSSAVLAIRELQAFLRAYPQGELADEARSRLRQLRERRAEHAFQVAQFYEDRAQFRSALMYYALIVDDYAGTAWASKAAAKVQDLRAATQ